MHVRRISLTWTTSVSKGRGILDRMSDAKSSITSCDDFPPLDVYEKTTKALLREKMWKCEINFHTENKWDKWAGIVYFLPVGVMWGESRQRAVEFRADFSLCQRFRANQIPVNHRKQLSIKPKTAWETYLNIAHKELTSRGDKLFNWTFQINAFSRAYVPRGVGSAEDSGYTPSNCHKDPMFRFQHQTWVNLMLRKKTMISCFL